MQLGAQRRLDSWSGDHGWSLCRSRLNWTNPPTTPAWALLKVRGQGRGQRLAPIPEAPHPSLVETRLSPSVCW